MATSTTAPATSTGRGSQSPPPRTMERQRCPRCRGPVELLGLQTWDPHRVLVLCADPDCGRIHLRTAGDGRRRRTLTEELPIPPLSALGLEPECPPPDCSDEAARAAAREILRLPPRP